MRIQENDEKITFMQQKKECTKSRYPIGVLSTFSHPFFKF